MSLNYEIIELASEGYFYPSSSLLSSGKLRLYPITAKQEEILANGNLAKQGLLEKELIEEIVVDNIDYNSLLNCDKNSILLNSRIANYGVGGKLKMKCESCDTDFEQDISFAFRPVPFNFNNIERGTNRLEYTFPKCSKKVCFKLPTCNEHRIYEEYGWLTFAKVITLSIEGVDDIEYFYDNELGATDSNAFRTFYQKNTPGYINTISISCPSCKLVKKSKIDINTDIFGITPEVKMNIHGEIFDLCYYSNGAFTQDGVYNMPTFLRSFYIKKLVDAKKAEADAQNKASQSKPASIARPPSVKK